MKNTWEYVWAKQSNKLRVYSPTYNNQSIHVKYVTCTYHIVHAC